MAGWICTILKNGLITFCNFNKPLTFKLLQGFYLRHILAVFYKPKSAVKP